MSICNYCILEKIKASAKAENKLVTIKDADFEEIKEFNEDEPGKDVFIDGEWFCWLMQIPDHCEC